MLVCASVLVLLQLSFRAWAIAGGWFYGDDLKFLSQASTEPLTLEFLFTRHQQQLMPGGILVAWLIGQLSAFSWTAAATTILLMQAAASVACVFMLVRLFGARPAILFPLALFLFSPLTLGAFMWWAAALNQLPLQIVFFLIIATHVDYLRTHQYRWLAGSVALLIVGLLFYVKSIVILPVLAFLTVTYFVEGRLDRRIILALTRNWIAWTLYGATAAMYLVGYTRTGESPVGGGRDSAYLSTADRQIRETLGPALLGGPWRWLDPGRQDVLSHAPEFAITLTWIVIAALVMFTIRGRKGAWPAWLLLALYLIPTTFLTANGRASLFGPDTGLYLRYLTDAAVVACLALACALMGIKGSSFYAQTRVSYTPSARPWIAAGCVVFVVGSFWSTITYASFWHRESPAETFVTNAARSLGPVDGVQIIDSPVSADLVLKPNAPFDRPSKLLAPLGKQIQPVTRGTDLEMFDSRGRLSPALVIPGITSARPKNDCGTLIKGRKAKMVALQSATTNETWWLAVNYLASDDTELVLEAGDNLLTYPLDRGPHMLFVRTKGSYDEVSLKVLDGDTKICVSQISVGFVGTLN